MTLPLVVLGAIGTVLAGNLAYDYLFPNADLPDVGDTTSLPDGLPYEPPFVGGQCLNQYFFQIKVDYTSGDSFYTVQAGGGGRFFPYTFSDAQGGGTQITGAVRGLDAGAVQSNGQFFILKSADADRSIFFAHQDFGTRLVTGASIVNLWRTGGQADDCGDLPNPNATESPSIPSGGVPQNGTPATTPDDQLVEAGLPVVFAPSVLSLLAGLAAQLGSAIASAAAAADALAATKAVAEAVDKLAKMLDAHKETLEKLRKYLNKKEKEDEANRQYFIRQYGTILRDGYLDLTPRPAPVGFKPLMLDFLCANVPNTMGRFFGTKSYNWFRYRELGSICFLSPTSGVLSVHKIEHVRTSIPIPELAIGFTYNMGLDGVIRARVSMLYTQEKT